MNIKAGKVELIIKTKYKEADFWIHRIGTSNTIGTVSFDNYADNKIGITVIDKHLLDVNFLYYFYMYLKTIGYWFSRIHGTCQQFINVKDVKEALQLLK